MSTIDALTDWLIDGARGATTSQEVIERLSLDLRAAGVPVDRFVTFVRTLHPIVAGRAFRWSLDSGVEVIDLPHDQFASSRANSPVAECIDSKAEVRSRIRNGVSEGPYTAVRELAKEGFTDYVVMPMPFMNGTTHAVAFATRFPGGFTDGHVDSLRRVMRPLGRVAEILAQARFSATILSTYVGRNSGERILAGQIQKGHFETIRALIWFSDLRAFTELSSRAPAQEVIDTLNRVFECQVPPIEKRGGEVLKFMGDGLLAIFPLGESDASASRAVADLAIEAADEAIAAIAAQPPLRIGVALHVGELAYGNIGSSNRLDFTAIGAAVNLAARLEGLTSKLGKPLVISEALAGMTSRQTEDLGTFDLKGVSAPVRAFAPRS